MYSKNPIFGHVLAHLTHFLANIFVFKKFDSVKHNPTWAPNTMLSPDKMDERTE